MQPMPELTLPAPWRAVALDEADAPALQRFFDDNPLYFETVTGQPAQLGDAVTELQECPPEGWPYTAVWRIGFQRVEAPVMGPAPAASIDAMAHIVADLLAPGVWHLGLFIVATTWHGRGAAPLLHDGLSRWAIGQGARWMRLGVVVGNARAERFWAACGYQPVARRTGIPAGARLNDVTIMARALTGEPIDRYFALIERDRPPGWADPVA